MKKKQVKEFAVSEDGRKERVILEQLLSLVSPSLNERVLKLLLRQDGATHDIEMGSCVLVKDSGRVFLLTAAHVLDVARKSDAQNRIYLYGGGVFELTGQAFMRADDFLIGKEKVVVDAAALELRPPVPDTLVKRAWDISSLSAPSNDFWHVLAGFPDSGTIRDRNSVLYSFTLIPTAVYGSRYVNSGPVALEMDDGIVDDASVGFLYYGTSMRNDQLVEGRSIKGMSGGAVFCIDGAPHDLDAEPADTLGVLLTAIIVEQRKRTMSEPPLVIATNVLVHRSMITSIRERSDPEKFQWTAIDRTIRKPRDG